MDNRHLDSHSMDNRHLDSLRSTASPHQASHRMDNHRLDSRRTVSRSTDSRLQDNTVSRHLASRLQDNTVSRHLASRSTDNRQVVTSMCQRSCVCVSGSENALCSSQFNVIVLFYTFFELRRVRRVAVLLADGRTNSDWRRSRGMPDRIHSISKCLLFGIDCRFIGTAHSSFVRSGGFQR